MITIEIPKWFWNNQGVRYRKWWLNRRIMITKGCFTSNILKQTKRKEKKMYYKTTLHDFNNVIERQLSVSKIVMYHIWEHKILNCQPPFPVSSVLCWYQNKGYTERAKCFIWLILRKYWIETWYPTKWSNKTLKHFSFCFQLLYEAYIHTKTVKAPKTC